MSKILVTGGAGFIGSHLVDKLIDLGHEVLVIDNLRSGKKENVNPKAIFIEDDIRFINTCKGMENGIEFVFHLAAIPRVTVSVENPYETHQHNINGTFDLLNWAKESKVNNIKKIIFASSSSVYGDQKLPYKETMRPKPISPYAFHKFVGEEYMRLFDELYEISTVSLRFFNVYGKRCDPNSPYSLVIGKFLKQRAEGKTLSIFGDGEQTRDFTYVDDVVNGLILAMQKPVHNEVINLCNGHNVSVNYIADLIGGVKQHYPPRKGDVLHTKGSNKKAKKLLGWKPYVSIEEGLKLMEGDYNAPVAKTNS